MSKLRHTVEEQQKTLEAMAGMPSLCCQTCAMHDACSGEARRQEKIVRRVEVELEGARGAIAQSNAKRDEAELQLRNEQQKLQQMQQQHQQQQQQHRMRIDELVRRCDDATTAAADAKAAVAAAVARAEEAEVQLAFPP